MEIGFPMGGKVVSIGRKGNLHRMEVRNALHSAVSRHFEASENLENSSFFCIFASKKWGYNEYKTDRITSME